MPTSAYTVYCTVHLHIRSWWEDNIVEFNTYIHITSWPVCALADCLEKPRLRTLIRKHLRTSFCQMRIGNIPHGMYLDPTKYLGFLCRNFLQIRPWTGGASLAQWQLWPNDILWLCNIPYIIIYDTPCSMISWLKNTCDSVIHLIYCPPHPQAQWHPWFNATPSQGNPDWMAPKCNDTMMPWHPET